MPEMEKLTINVNPVDLGQIELLVEQGFYANRAEFIRVAIQSQLSKHADTVKEASIRLAYVIGAVIYDRATLERAVEANRRIALRVVGFLSLSDDISPELAAAAIESVKVHGIFKASKAVKNALADRMS
jgi:Arc/MetJ-type ribon-helix-helix transcriptional regulator